MISVAVVELTNRCEIYENFSREKSRGCLHCSLNKFSRKLQELDYDLFIKILNDNDKMKNPIKTWELGWNGDPLLHSRIHDIIGELVSRGYGVNIVTNGYKFFEKIKKIESYMKNVHFTLLLYSPDTDNDFLMAPGVLEDTIDALNYLKANRPGFNILMGLNSYNYNKINDMVNLAKNYGVTVIPFETFGRSMTDYQKIEAIKTIDKLNGKEIHKTITFEDPHGNCTYLRNLRIFINSRGYLSFCHFISFLDVEMVNLREHSLEEAIRINENIRNKYVKMKMEKLPKWVKPRTMASPCSFCYKTFGGKELW